MHKRKIIASDTSDKDDIFERYSSLRVNMSYIANLTDSSNGSLHRSEVKSIENAKNNRNLQESQVKEGIYQEDMSAKKQALEINCKQLKDAILNNTKAIFNRKNELSIKPAMEREAKENFVSSDTHSSNSENKSIFMLKANNHCLKNEITMKHRQCTNQQRRDRYLNIIATPISKNRQNFKQTVDKSRLTQRRLFVTNIKPVEHTKCQIIKDIVLKNSSILSKQTDQNSSPILSGSNRKISPKLYVQNQFKGHNNIFSTEHSIQNIDIGAPITSSTFIENNTIKGKKNRSYNKTDSDINTSHATHTTNKIISMEMTEICGIIQTSKEQDRNSNINNYIEDKEEEKSKIKSLNQRKNATIQKLKKTYLNKLTIQNNAYTNVSCVNIANDAISTCVDVVPVQVSTEEVEVATKMNNTLQAQKYENEIKNQSEKECTLLLSDSSIHSNTRSSLNVNTSLNVMIKTSKANSSSNYKIIDTNQNFRATITNEKPIVLNNQHKSVNSIQTSLQMNTSIDSMCETKSRRNNRLIKQSLIQERIVKNVRENYSCTDNQYLTTEDKETDDVVFLENISLFERLRNISTQNQSSYNVQSNIYEMRDKEKAESDKSNNVASLKYQSNDHTDNNCNNCSCVEETPYPVSRSVLFKSLLKCKTQNIENNATSCSINLIDNKENKDKTKSDVLNPEIPNKTPKTVNTDIIMSQDILSSDSFLIQNQLILTENACNNVRFQINYKSTSQNMECIAIRKGKKKLLPLNENSQLCSITPVEEDKCTTKKSISEKKKKN